eukprot:TRINITY_DN1823_c0_g2_i2.p2 TRINITY_DN1823_c0_g2~~TRINITY_DN1823_c0_g2_i2.p2  ORF type:complete len:149 (+),score=25.95 TRINITY_DN1823_c0_g2_i2:358-804(+)
MELSKKGKSILASMKTKKDYYNPETLGKLMSNFNVEDFGSNLSTDIFNPKNIVKSQAEYYDGITKKQTEVQLGGPSMRKPTTTAPADGKKKSLWDATSDPVNEANQQRINQMMAIDPLALIAAQNKAFVGKRQSRQGINPRRILDSCS